MGVYQKRDYIYRFRSFFKRWFPFLAGCFIVLIIIIIGTIFQESSSEISNSSTPAPLPVEPIENTIKDILVAHHTLWEIQDDGSNPPACWTIRVPTDLPIPSLHLAIQEGLADVDGQILEGKSDPLLNTVSLYIGIRDSCLFLLHLVSSPTLWRDSGKIVILIDDFGNRWNTFVRSFFELPGQINISVIPGFQLSRKVAVEAQKKGCEVLLHLPMEPVKADVQDNGYTILTRMTHSQMERVLKRALEDVPGVFGINNHMGSKVTADPRAMTTLLQIIRSMNLYFLDSRTSTVSVAYELAQKLGLRCGKRDIFLDAKMDKESIRNQLYRLVQKAKSHGYAVGIGHCHRHMLEILRDEMPKIQEKGYRFVQLSEVIR